MWLDSCNLQVEYEALASISSPMLGRVFIYLVHNYQCECNFMYGLYSVIVYYGKQSINNAELSKNVCSFTNRTRHLIIFDGQDLKSDV